MKNFWIKAYYFLIGTIVIFLLTCYSFSFFSIRVDTISISLLTMLLLIPILFILKKFKISGFEAEIKESEIKTLVEKVEVEKIRLEEKKKNYDETVRPLTKNPLATNKYIYLREQFLYFFDTELDVAAASMLRTILMDKIETLYASMYKNPVMLTPPELMIKGLVDRQHFEENLRDLVLDLFRICEEIIHGVKLQKKDSTRFISTAIDLLDILDTIRIIPS